MSILAALSLLVAVIFGCLWRNARVELHRSVRQICAKEVALDTLRKHLVSADEIRHSIANSARRGCPAVKWHRPYPVPAGADAFYWRAMFAGEPHLFTDEVLREARSRASRLLPSGRSIPSTATHSTPCATS